MKKSIQIAYDPLFEEKCHLAAKAGFRHIAINYTEICGKTASQWDAITDDILRILDETGLRCVQSHPHYYSPILDSEDRDEALEEAIRQSIRSSGRVGAEFCVIHPRSSEAYQTSRSLAFNQRWFSELLECALQNGTGIAAENLPIFPSGHQVRRLFSSDFEDLAALVDSFNDLHMAICWDFGHAHLLRGDQTVAIRALGERIGCTHVHNNWGVRDDHSTPDIGSIEWARVMSALAASGYNGPLTLETHCWYDDRELRRSFVRHNYACLEYLERLARGRELT